MVFDNSKITFHEQFSISKENIENSRTFNEITCNANENFLPDKLAQNILNNKFVFNAEESKEIGLATEIITSMEQIKKYTK
ncbi:hypothetical protein D3C73_1014760 [compost metagenome]